MPTPDRLLLILLDHSYCSAKSKCTHLRSRWLQISFGPASSAAILLGSRPSTDPVTVLDRSPLPKFRVLRNREARGFTQKIRDDELVTTVAVSSQQANKRFILSQNALTRRNKDHLLTRSYREQSRRVWEVSPLARSLQGAAPEVCRFLIRVAG